MTIPEGAARIIVGALRDGAPPGDYSANQLRAARLYTGGCSRVSRLIDAEIERRVAQPVDATIERQGRCREDAYSEPYARLADGRLLPMGHNLSGPIYPVGTKGTARYVTTPLAGLWLFEPYTDGKEAT